MQRETILVVDDDPGILAFIKTNLQARGYRILTATSGPEALSAAALDDPDLVILDLLMPDVDGMEVTRALRERSTVPIIVLSALQQDVTKVRALEL
ncbi:MAG: response regulator, partial [Armatimonadota bacterium]|nr:response regulator [Armatimonadota bacterium]